MTADRDQPLVVHVVGARPNFMKAAPVIRALEPDELDQVLIHTGQHYDRGLSEIFFESLPLPEPDVHLGVGSGSHAQQTAALLTKLEAAFLELSPDLVVVYGDVNSTLAAALAASKLGIPFGHVEAGLRSFDRSMPEEINRVVTDALADLLFVTSPEALAHLADEGIAAVRMHFVGNPMIDTLLDAMDKLDSGPLREQLNLHEPFALVTLHRPSNVDEPAAAARVVEALERTSEMLAVVIPLHPRGRESLSQAGLRPTPRTRVIEPLGYYEFIGLMREAAVVITDSGGIQEETTVLGVPCLTVRPNTERPITISHGTNRLVEPEQVADAVREILSTEVKVKHGQPPLWDGHAGARIADVIRDWLRGWS